MAWTPETSSILAQLRDYLARGLDDHTRTTVAAWVRAWDSLAPELEAAIGDLILQAGEGPLRRADVTRSIRLQLALEQIRDRLALLTDESARIVIDRLDDVVEFSGAIQDRLLASQLPPSERASIDAWTRVDRRAVDAIVVRTSEQITKLSYPLADEAAEVMRRELVRGLVTGANPKATAARMLRNSEVTFNG